MKAEASVGIREPTSKSSLTSTMQCICRTGRGCGVCCRTAGYLPQRLRARRLHVASGYIFTSARHDLFAPSRKPTPNSLAKLRAPRLLFAAVVLHVIVAISYPTTALLLARSCARTTMRARVCVFAYRLLFVGFHRASAVLSIPPPLVRRRCLRRLRLALRFTAPQPLGSTQITAEFTAQEPLPSRPPRSLKRHQVAPLAEA